MTNIEFQRLKAYDYARRIHRQHQQRSVQSRRSVRSVGNGTGRSDLKRSSIIAADVDNIINTRVTYANVRA